MRDSKERFSDRVEDYRKYRPGYPREALDVLGRHCGLGPASRVADIGSGTGILTALLLERAARVFAVEPNPPMRAAAEADLGGRPGFASIAGSAESTTLPDACVDLVTAGQAFHWFDAGLAREEFRRILAPGGKVALIWNERRAEIAGFQADYDGLIEEHLGEVRSRNISGTAAMGGLEAFFRPLKPTCVELDNAQRLDWDGLKGRLLSSSYVPKPGQPKHDLVLGALGRLFERHARHGYVSLEYKTRIFFAE